MPWKSRLPEYGHGLDPLLKRARSPSAWDHQWHRPKSMESGLRSGTSGRTLTLKPLDARSTVKRGLQAELGLPVDERLPLFGMVGRLDRQKGVDLALEALEALGNRPWQWVLLGDGDTAIEDLARGFATRFADRARAELRFDPTLARRIYGGVDMLLVPSRYEPCGLSQMIAMRYGAVPVARATGGLKDTVQDVRAGKQGTGFVYHEDTPEALAEAMTRAMDAYAHPGAWRTLQQVCMRADHSWDVSAEAYFDLYEEILGGDGVP